MGFDLGAVVFVDAGGDARGVHAVGVGQYWDRVEGEVETGIFSSHFEAVPSQAEACDVRGRVDFEFGEGLGSGSI